MVRFICGGNHGDYYRKTAEILTNTLNAINIDFHGKFDLANTPLSTMLKSPSYFYLHMRLPNRFV